MGPPTSVGEGVEVNNTVIDDLLTEENTEGEQVIKEDTEECQANGAFCGGEEPTDSGKPGKEVADLEMKNYDLLRKIFKYFSEHEEFMALVQVFNNTQREFNALAHNLNIS